jgi:hypothetical protein
MFMPGLRPPPPKLPPDPPQPNLLAITLIGSGTGAAVDVGRSPMLQGATNGTI